MTNKCNHVGGCLCDYSKCYECNRTLPNNVLRDRKGDKVCDYCLEREERYARAQSRQR